MELLLIRHGLPRRVVDADGPADPPLAPEGVAQAERLGLYLAGEGVDAIWSSPLRRALDTAAIVARHCGSDVLVHDGLAETDRASSTYIPMEEYRERRDERWTAIVDRMRTREGSSAAEQAFRAVVVDAMEAIVADNPGRRVAVVCHAGVINAYVGHVLGIDRPLWFDPGYAGLSRVLASRGGDRGLGSLNETMHLREPRAPGRDPP